MGFLTRLMVCFMMTILIAISSIHDHEITHKEIFENYGCQTTQHFMQTIGVCNLTESKEIAMIQDHHINEIIGYNIFPLMWLIIFLLMYEVMQVMPRDRD